MSSVEEWGDHGSELAIVGVHGRGQPVQSIRDIDARIGLSARWVAPIAPGGSWYARRFMDHADEDDHDVDHSLLALDSAVGALIAGDYPLHRIVLLGFSQGACLIAHYALRFPRAFAGLVLFTGGYIGPEDSPTDFDGDFERMPVLLATSDQDPWVPHGRVLETDGEFRRLNARVTCLVEPGDEHGVTETAILLARTLITGAALAR